MKIHPFTPKKDPKRGPNATLFLKTANGRNNKDLLKLDGQIVPQESALKWGYQIVMNEEVLCIGINVLTCSPEGGQLQIEFQHEDFMRAVLALGQNWDEGDADE